MAHEVKLNPGWLAQAGKRARKQAARMRLEQLLGEIEQLRQDYENKARPLLVEANKQQSIIDEA